MLGPVLITYLRESQLAAGVERAAAYDMTLYILSGLLVLGLSLQSSWRESLLMVLIWLIVMASGAVSCQLLARFSDEQPSESATQQED